MSAPSLLTTATAVSRSASGFVAKAVRGFQVLRVDGYSLTKMIPGGESISSRFEVGTHSWLVDYYPNGAERSKDDSDSDSDYISLYLRLQSVGGYNYSYSYNHLQRVQVQYKFSLLDAAGDLAYERPAETGVFACSRHAPHLHPHPYGLGPEPEEDLQGLGCGHGEFIIVS